MFFFLKGGFEGRGLGVVLESFVWERSEKERDYFVKLGSRFFVRKMFNRERS